MQYQKCHIGTSILVGDEVEVEMERIAKEAGSHNRYHTNPIRVHW